MIDTVTLIDKPVGWTSFDVVAKVRGRIRAQYTARGEKPTKRQLRVGHAGTLDPFATGLLIILIGDECKKAGEFLKLDKVYEATIRLGENSTTGDPEGTITKHLSVTDPTCNRDEKCECVHVPLLNDVERVLGEFVGQITQIPPAHSAIKIDGVRAYKLARAGKDVVMPERQVTIHSIELLDYSYPDVRIRAHVGSGTYIRTLAQDIGERLGTGAYCSQLRRTRVGQWSIEAAEAI